MNRSSDRKRNDVETAGRDASSDARRPVDETQARRQETTAPHPRIDASAPHDAEDDVASSDLDEAWGRWCEALADADRDFDPQAAYARLAAALPADLVALPLMERAALQGSRDARAERRSFAWGLAAMLLVCAGLAALAVYGPEWERRQDATALRSPRGESEDRTPDAAPVSPGLSETWEDAAWDERLEALAAELDAERRRAAGAYAGPEGPPRYRLEDLELDFARVRQSFDRRSEF